MCHFYVRLLIILSHQFMIISEVVGIDLEVNNSCCYEVNTFE